MMVEMLFFFKSVATAIPDAPPPIITQDLFRSLYLGACWWFILDVMTLLALLRENSVEIGEFFCEYNCFSLRLFPLYTFSLLEASTAKFCGEYLSIYISKISGPDCKD